MYPKSSQNGRDKFRKIRLWAPWAAKGAPMHHQRPPKFPKWSPRAPQSLQNGAQGSPKASKLVPKAPPKHQKRYPSDPQSTQNGAQDDPRRPKVTPLHFFNLFSIRFLLILARFVITPTLNFGALACTRCDFSSLREVAGSSNTTSKYLQTY